MSATVASGTHGKATTFGDKAPAQACAPRALCGRIPMIVLAVAELSAVFLPGNRSSLVAANLSDACASLAILALSYLAIDYLDDRAWSVCSACVPTGSRRLAGVRCGPGDADRPALDSDNNQEANAQKTRNCAPG